MRKINFLSCQSLAIVFLLLLGGLYHFAISQEIDFPAGPHKASLCTENWTDLPADVTPVRVNPSKIVVQPWRGRHHVYAEFEVPPQGFFISDRFRIDLKDFGAFCGVASSAMTPEGKGITTARLRTRTALWLIFQGKLNDLNQASNWQLEMLPLNSRTIVPNSNLQPSDPEFDRPQ